MGSTTNFSSIGSFFAPPTTTNALHSNRYGFLYLLEAPSSNPLEVDTDGDG